MQAIEEMFLNAVPVTPRDPIAAPSAPRMIESCEESQTNAAVVAVGVGVGVGVELGVTEGVGVGVGIGLELLPQPVNNKIAATRIADLAKTFTVVSLNSNEALNN